MLQEGQIIRLPFGGIYRVKSVTPSRAYCVPVRRVKSVSDEVFDFDSGAVNISPNSHVDYIDEDQLEAELTRKTGPIPAPVNSQHQGRIAMSPSVSPLPVARSTRDKDLERRKGLARRRADRHANLPGTGGKSRLLAGAAARSSAKAKAAPKAAKTVRACACGCGTETMGFFAPGHDARAHGAIKKLADGRMQPKDYPHQSFIKGLQLTKTAKGYKAGAPHFWKD